MAAPKIDKLHLSGSTDGRQILVAATASPGTLIHTAQAGATDGSYDEVWLYAVNSSATVAVKLTIEFGGTGTGDQIETKVPPESGLFLALPGYVLRNSLIVRAFAATTNVVAVGGYVNRLTAGV